MASDMIAALSANNSDTLEAIEKEFKDRAGARQIEPRFAAQQPRHQGASKPR